MMRRIKQRVSFGRVLMMIKSRLLFLDEPFGGLYVETQKNAPTF